METIKFECEVITPMFLGGADGKGAELRAPSIKGALRFWWRAMNGHLPLKELHEREAEIFGGSGDKQGRSKVIVRVVPVSIKKSSSPLSGKIAENPSWYRTDIRADVLRYLTLGTFAMGENHGNHEYFEPSSKFNVAFSFIASNYQKEINLAFHLLSSFGGLGSKSRNGLGSFSILSDNKNAEKIQIKSQTIPDFSAFSKNSKLFQTKKGFTTWKPALEELGDIYRITRLTADGNKYIFKNRVYLTQPMLKANRDSVLERHAKPFFMSIKREKNLYYGNLLYLPSFYMKDSDIKFLQPSLSINQANQNFQNACQKFIQILSADSRITEVSL